MNLHQNSLIDSFVFGCDSLSGIFYQILVLHCSLWWNQHWTISLMSRVFKKY